MFIDTLPFEVMTSKTTSVPKIIFFLRSAPRDSLDFVLDQCWRGSKIISVNRWELTGDGQWALHIDLKPLGRQGEEAYIPFPWPWGDEPSVREAVGVFRNMRGTYA